MFGQIEDSWKEELRDEIEKPYVKELLLFLEEEERRGHQIYPEKGSVFRALAETPFPEVKVVILGQDPYHGEGQAHGLSFSVPMGVKIPPSLRNIFTEMKNDLGVTPPDHGCLLSYAKQGVLLLNSTLTVRSGEPKSHYGRGWEQFTDQIIASLCSREEPVIFALWGKSAQEKVEKIASSREKGHTFLLATHPSPYSAHSGFFGCSHFSKINFLLEKRGKAPIDWQLS